MKKPTKAVGRKTVKGRNGGTLKPFEKGVSGNENGRPKGRRNRATAVKEVFALPVKRILDVKTYAQLKAILPNITDQSDIEEVMTAVQAHNAIINKSVASYKALKDDRYGRLEGDSGDGDGVVGQIINIENLFVDTKRLKPVDIEDFDEAEVVEETKTKK